MSTTDDAPIRNFESMHCRQCKRLLLKIQHRALRPAYVLEILCRCKTMNYVIGTPSTEYRRAKAPN